MARTKTGKARPRSPAPALAVLLVLIVVAAFAPGLGNDFVSWDDGENFLENPSFRGLGWSQIRWAWTSFHVGVYQPLAWMILEAQYALFGLKPWGYHLTSLILYAINTVVLFLLTLTLLARCRSGPERENSRGLVFGAAVAVALYAVHPLRTEVVVWASCQPYLPCALFSMLAVLAYLQAFRNGPAPRRGYLAGTFLLVAAALLSKAVAVSLPLVLLILDVYPLGRLGAGTRPGRWFGPAARRVWLEKVPLIGMSLIFMGIAVAGRSREHDLVAVPNWGIAPAIGQACSGVWFYLIKTVLPRDLMAYYPLPTRVVLLENPFLLSLLGTFSVSLILFCLRRRWPGLLAVWLSYLVILGPNLGLVRRGGYLAADRYSYMAMMGSVVLLAAVLGRVWRTGRRVWPTIAVSTAVSLGLLVVLILLSRGQCRTWRTSEILWTHALNHGASQDPEVHNNLGASLREQGRFEEAGAQFAAVLRLKPDHALGHNNLGFILYRQGRLEEAGAHYAEAIRLKPDLAAAHNNLGLVLNDQGRLDEARARCTAAVRIEPTNADAHDNLGVILFRSGRIEESSAEFAEAIRLEPDFAQAHQNMGALLLSQGRLEQARSEFAAAVRLDANHAR